MERKRAELTSMQITIVILLIIGFAIVLYFVYRIFFAVDVDRNLCHESVILRATVPSIASRVVPLKCKTLKYCITAKTFGKGECDEMKNEKDVTTVRVKDINNLQRFLAREILACWIMMGEGKIGIFDESAGKKLALKEGAVYPSCVLCSRVAFDKKSFNEKEIDFSQGNLMTYMRTHYVDDTKKTYFDYFSDNGNFNLGNLGDKIKLTDLGKIGEDKDSNPKEISLEAAEQGKNPYAEFSIVFSQISAPNFQKVLANDMKALGLIFGAGMLTSPVKTIRTGSKLTSPITLGVALGVIAYQGMNVYEYRNMAAIKCADVSGAKESRDGCSAVRVVPYTPADIPKYCSVIESMP